MIIVACISHSAYQYGIRHWFGGVGMVSSRIKRYRCGIPFQTVPLPALSKNLSVFEASLFICWTKPAKLCRDETSI